MSELQFICSKNERVITNGNNKFNLLSCNVQTIKGVNDKNSLNRGIYQDNNDNFLIFTCNKNKCCNLTYKNKVKKMKCAISNNINYNEQGSENNSIFICKFNI